MDFEVETFSIPLRTVENESILADEEILVKKVAIARRICLLRNVLGGQDAEANECQ